MLPATATATVGSPIELPIALQGLAMLVLSRKKDEKIIIGDSITLMVIEIRGDKVRLGIEAPKEIAVHRQEVYDAIVRENEMQQEADAEASKPVER
jgi:carbon storage regulator